MFGKHFEEKRVKIKQSIGVIDEVIAVNGSPREDGKTSAALKIKAEELEKEGNCRNCKHRTSCCPRLHSLRLCANSGTRVFSRMTGNTKRPQRYAKRTDYNCLPHYYAG